MSDAMRIKISCIIPLLYSLNSERRCCYLSKLTPIHSPMPLGGYRATSWVLLPPVARPPPRLPVADTGCCSSRLTCFKPVGGRIWGDAVTQSYQGLNPHAQ